MAVMVGQPLSNLYAEAERVTAAFAQQHVPARITGGLAVARRCPAARQPPLAREYADLDLVCAHRAWQVLARCLDGLGYQPDKHFNAVHGRHRLYFVDPMTGAHIDVFVGVVKMCHEIDVSRRLELLDDTLTPSDLLLTKLQIVEINHKDLLDLLALVHDQPLEAGRDDALDPAYLGGLWGADWPLWRTSRQTLEHVRQIAGTTLSDPMLARATETITALEGLLASCHKTRRWQLRARIGDRMRWYELPDEIEG
jgi:hypothetical protein